MKKIGLFIINSLFVAFFFCSCNGDGEIGSSGSITGAWLKTQTLDTYNLYSYCEYLEFDNNGIVKAYCYDDKARALDSETGKLVDTIPHWDFGGMCRYDYDSKDAFLTIYSSLLQNFFLTWSDSKHVKVERFVDGEYLFVGEFVKTTKNNSISDYQALHKK